MKLDFRHLVTRNILMFLGTCAFFLTAHSHALEEKTVRRIKKIGGQMRIAQLGGNIACGVCPVNEIEVNFEK